MLPVWILGSFAAAAGAQEEGEVEEDDDDEVGKIRKLVQNSMTARGYPPQSPPTSREGRTVWQLWTDEEDTEPVYTVDIGDGYVISAYDDYSDAKRAADGTVDNDPATTEVFVYRYDRVPAGLREKVLRHGSRREHSDFGDGYEVSHALRGYLSEDGEEGERGLAYSWELHRDVDFKDWPDEEKHAQREMVFSDHHSDVDLPAGSRIYLLTGDPQPFLDKKADEDDDRLPLLAVSTRKTDAPGPAMVFDENYRLVRPSTAWLVTLELAEPIPANRVVIVPWEEPGTSSTGKKRDDQISIDWLTEVFEEGLDPKDPSFDPDEILEKAEKMDKYFSVLAVRTAEKNAALMFIDPLDGCVHLRVLSVDPVGP